MMKENKKTASINGIARNVSDIFSRQYCDMASAKKYAILMTNGRCLYCGEELIKVHNGKAKSKVKKYCFDHVYPASRLNLFDVGNIALSCENCNMSKSDKLPLEFYKKRRQHSLSLLFEDKNEFEAFLKTFSEPYVKKWPKNYNINFSKVDINYFRDTLVSMMYEIDFVIREKTTGEKTKLPIVVDDRYVNRFLTQDEKRKLVEELDIRSEQGVPLKWTTTKRYLISSGYEIIEKIKKHKNKRKTLIMIKSNTFEQHEEKDAVYEPPLSLDSKYLNKPLFRNEKLEIAKIVNSPSSSALWPTAKKTLINSGYKIEDKIKKTKGVRKSYSIITN